MKKTILYVSVMTAFVFAFTEDTFSQKKTKDKVLAYRMFTVEMTETTAKKAGKTVSDEISFKSEKLNSKFINQENHFVPFLYTVSVDSSSSPAIITFTSEGKNPDGEEIKWDGTVTDKDIEGAVVISKKGKTKKEYSFIGTQKEKPAKK